MKPFMQEFIVGFILVMVLVIFTIGGLSNMHDAQHLLKQQDNAGVAQW